MLTHTQAGPASYVGGLTQNDFVKREKTQSDKTGFPFDESIKFHTKNRSFLIEFLQRIIQHSLHQKETSWCISCRSCFHCEMREGMKYVFAMSLACVRLLLFVFSHRQMRKPTMSNWADYVHPLNNYYIATSMPTNQQHSSYQPPPPPPHLDSPHVRSYVACGTGLKLQPMFIWIPHCHPIYKL